MPMTAHSIKQLEPAAGEISHAQQALSRHYPKLVSVEQNDYQRQKNKSVLEPPPVYIGDELVERVDTNLNYLEWGFKTTSNGTI
jgi:hypothetical protein